MRSTESTAIFRDGASHVVGVNVPRFEYGGDSPLGMPLSASEALSFHTGNRLETGTLIWFEDGAAKVAPFNELNPFFAGEWRGSLGKHIKKIAHSKELLSDAEIDKIIQVLADELQAPFVSNDWILEEPLPLTSLTRQLTREPDLDTLLLSVDGTLLRRVASDPALMQFSASERTLTFGIEFSGYPVIRTVYRRNNLSGAGFSIEDLTGTKDGANLSFTVSQAPTDGVVIVVWQGVALEKVDSGPGLGEYTISGTDITLGTGSGGTAPASTDDLWAFLMTSGAGFAVENLSGTKDDANKEFTISSAALENVGLIFHTGVSLTRVGNTPATMQCLLNGTDVTLGIAPSANDGLWGFLKTS